MGTLDSLVVEDIKASTRIDSDGWKGYNNYGSLTDKYGKVLYDHKTVEHTKNFVDPISGACTNRIEGTWGIIKNWLRQERGVKHHILQSKLDEFMVRWNFCNMDNIILFWRMLEWISQEYKCHF